MADIADRANDAAEAELARNLANAGVGKFELSEGKAGDCELCGEWSSRLVDAACAPCRDRYKLQ